ncbi:MAG: dihydroorotate dehydrogenase [Treponema sp.]|nr:dihydroorotate dehydrogenase [Treponema sp.]
MDLAEIDDDGKGLLFYGTGLVTKKEKIEGQPNVYLLETEIQRERKTQVAPKPGQFYLIRSGLYSMTYNRPISVYHSEAFDDGKVKIQFMILQKGEGTRELCSLKSGDEMKLIGPLGNGFVLPQDANQEPALKPEICILGGGIGVAPVANFASSLKDGSYDFYASFKSGTYGLENVKAKNLVITTDDGSVGIHGMITAAFTKEKVEEAGYRYVFACGPTPMLAYIQSVCDELGIKSFISMENRMLCGVGACLGCTIHTKEGMKRVCHDGPIFAGDILEFEKGAPRRKPLPPDVEPDLSVEIAGIKFKNPVIAASGTFGFGQNYRGLFDVETLGGVAMKGTTLEPREGNPGQRIVEVVGGNINSIGLQNPGVPHVIEHELPALMKLDTVAIFNLAGSDLESYVEGARLIDKTDVPMIELNISCPNVKVGGAAWGMQPDTAYKCVSEVRKVTSKPLMIKLTPNAPDYKGVAMACVKAGASALSLANLVQAVAIDIEKAAPVFRNVRGGYCGPAIKPLALRMVYDVVEEMNKLPENERIPVVGLGGIARWQDAIEYIMAGAAAVQIGSAKFTNPFVMNEVIDGIREFMKSHGYRTIKEMQGKAHIFMPFKSNDN